MKEHITGWRSPFLCTANEYSNAECGDNQRRSVAGSLCLQLARAVDTLADVSPGHLSHAYRLERLGGARYFRVHFVDENTPATFQHATALADAARALERLTETAENVAEGSTLSWAAEAAAVAEGLRKAYQQEPKA